MKNYKTTFFEVKKGTQRGLGGSKKNCALEIKQLGIQITLAPVVQSEKF
jgi:hypothetical protein